jgi:hypothetical protein
MEFINKAYYKQAEAFFRAGQPGHGIQSLWRCRNSKAYSSQILRMLRRELLPSLKTKFFRRRRG